MNTSALSRLLALACAVVAMAGVTACSSSGNPGVSLLGKLERLLPHHTAPVAVQHTAAAPPSIDGDMVTAVSSGKDDQMPVTVRFALRDRPEVGKASELDLEVIPSAPLDKLIAVFHAQDGLSVSAGAEPAQREHPEAGIPIAHRLTIVPARDGIFYVDATVLVDFGSESVARTFTIPIIAGAGEP